MKQKLKDFGLGLLVVGSMLFTCGLLSYKTVETVQLWQLTQALRERGVEATGQVVALELHDVYRGTDYCEVIYQFRPDTLVVRQKTTRVSDDFCNIFDVGSQVTVLYLPGDSQQSDLVWGGYVELQVFMLGLLVGGLFLVGLVAAIGLWLSSRFVPKARPDGATLLIKVDPGSIFVSVVAYSVFAILTLPTGAIVLGVVISRMGEQVWVVTLLAGLTALLFVGLGLGCVYGMLFTVNRYYVFGVQKIWVRGLVGQRVFDPAGLSKIRTLSTLPNQPHKTSYVIELSLPDKQIRIDPHWNKEQTLELAARLRTFYEIA